MTAAALKGQLSLNVGIGDSVRVIGTYDREYCGHTDEAGNADVCIGRGPVVLAVSGGYRLTERVEPMAELEFGIERDFGRAPNVEGPRIKAFAPGFRFFFSDAGRSKFFSTVQVLFDFSGYEASDGGSLGLDYGIRNVNGFQLDVHESFGVYFFFGEKISWQRWLRLEVDAGLGLQARFR